MDQFKLNKSKLSGGDKLGSNPNEMHLVCTECGSKISDLSNGLIVIERDNSLEYIDGHIVHKGDCDCVWQNKSADNCNEKHRVLPPNIFTVFSTTHWLNGSSVPYEDPRGRFL